jgi:hypothetical protein
LNCISFFNKSCFDSENILFIDDRIFSIIQTNKMTNKIKIKTSNQVKVCQKILNQGFETNWSVSIFNKIGINTLDNQVINQPNHININKLLYFFIIGK